MCQQAHANQDSRNLTLLLPCSGPHAKCQHPLCPGPTKEARNLCCKLWLRHMEGMQLQRHDQVVMSALRERANVLHCIGAKGAYGA